MDPRISAEIERGDEELARLQNDLAIVESAETATIDAIAKLNARYGVVDSSTFDEVVGLELRRARELNEDLAVVQVSLDRDMSLAERTTLYGQLVELVRSGDVIGAVSDTELALSLLWTDERTAENLGRTAAEMAHYAVPEGAIRYSVRLSTAQGTLTGPEPKSLTRVSPPTLVRSSPVGRNASV
jgi:hypothetical protein